MQVPVVRNVLEANEKRAQRLREDFAAKGILVLNLISSPGAGKTTLLEKTLADLKDEFKIAVVEGDLTTDNDARRIAATGTPAVQINTDGGCHLDARMIADALDHLDMTGLDLLIIENVGNLVCPVEFDVGEDHKIALLSTTEGDDKPEKYPGLFSRATVMVLNKTDLLPYVDFDPERAFAHARALNDGLICLKTSARNREGLEAWYDFIRAEVAKKRKV